MIMARFALLLALVASEASFASAARLKTEVDDPFHLVSQTWTPDVKMAMNIPGSKTPTLMAKYAINAERMVMLESTKSVMNMHLTGTVNMSIVSDKQKLYDLTAKKMTIYEETDTKLEGTPEELKMYASVPTGLKKACHFKEFPSIHSPAQVRTCIEDAVSKFPSSKTADGETTYAMTMDMPDMEGSEVSFSLTNEDLAAGFHMRMNTSAGPMVFDAAGVAKPGADAKDLAVHGQFGECVPDNSTLPMPTHGMAAEFLQCVGLI